MFPCKAGGIHPLVLHSQAGGSGKALILLPNPNQFDLILLKLLGVSGRFVNEDPAFLFPGGSFETSLPLGSFVLGVVFTVNGYTFLVFLTEPFQMLYSFYRMTTTVPAMEETIRLIRQKTPWCRVIVGGAVLTKEYAEKIGADHYAKDAMEAVRYAEQVLS